MRSHSAGGAADRLLAIRPQLLRVTSAGEAFGLAQRELLHAGPPLADGRRPPPVLLSSAVMVCLHEGWATHAEEAEALVRSGGVHLSPAQDRGVVLPLAALASASTPLFEVYDASGSALRAWAPISAARGPDTRMGFRGARVAECLAHRDIEVAPAWRRVLQAQGPLALYPLARQGLAAGDDLHSRTTSANQALVDWLRNDDAFATLAADVEATPLFFLTIWMAVCALVLRAVENIPGSTLVTRAGGNGENFGIVLAGAPGRWITTPAGPPRGNAMPSVPAETEVNAAIGDSAVIDLFGFGGQRLEHAPEPLGVLRDFLPADHAGLAERLSTVVHPDLLGQGVGIDAATVVAEDAAPIIAIAMLAADGERGFVGRGVYRLPVSLFQQAIDDLA
jgi:hypothetical protein